MSYLRFVIPTRDEDSGRRQGLFQALANLQNRGALLAHEEDEWTSAYEWFQKNLDEPDRFANSSRPHAKRVALSWFKDSASEHIRQMRRLSEILRDHGVEVTSYEPNGWGTWCTKTSIRS